MGPRQLTNKCTGPAFGRPVIRGVNFRMYEALREHNGDTLGEGVGKKIVRDLELKLDLELPIDYRNYLIACNYAELYGDPLFGIHCENTEIDIYARNHGEEHFRYGFLAIFANDIDGEVFLRPDSGAIYNAAFQKPIARSFNEFVELLLSQGS